MTDRWSDYDESEKRAVEVVSSVLTERARLVDSASDGDDRERKFGFTDLYAYATRADHVPEPGFHEALMNEPRLQSNLDALVSRGALCEFALAEVASTGELDFREEPGYSLQIQQSTAMPERSFIVIQLRDDTLAVPRILFARHTQGRLYKHALPPPDGDQIQFMIETNAPLLSVLRDPNSQLTLR